MTESDGRPELVYVSDPLCSWCWGFAPSLRRLREQHPDAFRYRLVVGGLRTGPSALPLDGGLRQYLAHAWREVERQSGQPFDHRILETAEFRYDTEPACRAVVAARSLDAERVFAYNEALQESFYVRGLDPTRSSTFAAVASELGLDEEAFRSRLDSGENAAETRRDFDRARDLGVMGFPATIVRSDGDMRLLASGFVPPDELLERARPYL